MPSSLFLRRNTCNFPLLSIQIYLQSTHLLCFLTSNNILPSNISQMSADSSISRSAEELFKPPIFFAGDDMYSSNVFDTELTPIVHPHRLRDLRKNVVSCYQFWGSSSRRRFDSRDILELATAIGSNLNPQDDEAPFTFSSSGKYLA